MFRGIRQNSTGLCPGRPSISGSRHIRAMAGLKSVGMNFGSWNSLHSGDTGSMVRPARCGRSRTSTRQSVSDSAEGTSFSTTYTAYTSPNGGFTTVKEISFKLGIDDSGYLGKGALKPYVILAQEFETDISTGQADGGERGHLHGDRICAGLLRHQQGQHRVSDQDRLQPERLLRDPAGEDNKFGFFSVAGIVTVPLGGTTNFGRGTCTAA